MTRDGQPIKTIVSIAQKGGSGKSTITVHLAAYAHSQNIYSALCDLDPQGSAYDWNQVEISHLFDVEPY